MILELHKKVFEDRKAKGLVVQSHFDADSKGVTEGVANVGNNEVAFANEASRDEFIERVRRNGGTAKIL